jgi:hypothetical protein
MTALRTLHLTNAYLHLHFGRQTPWIATMDALGTSACVTAYHATFWFMTRVAHRATSLELIHITDEGRDGVPRSSPFWTLRVSYRVRNARNNGVRDLDVIGIPKLEMHPRYLPKS